MDTAFLLHDIYSRDTAYIRRHFYFNNGYHAYIAWLGAHVGYIRSKVWIGNTWKRGIQHIWWGILTSTTPPACHIAELHMLLIGLEGLRPTTGLFWWIFLPVGEEIRLEKITTPTLAILMECGCNWGGEGVWDRDRELEEERYRVRGRLKLERERDTEERMKQREYLVQG